MDPEAREREADRPVPMPMEAPATPATPEARTTPVQAPGPIPSVAQETTSGDAQTSASDQAYGALQPRGPTPGGPEIEATDAAMGQRMVDSMIKANAGGTLERGIHYAHNYKRRCEESGQPERWKNEYRKGHHFGDAFINPSETGRTMDFELKKGQSASKAIKSWLEGATVAECLSAIVAMEIDTLRAAIGDTKFDAMFGSDDAAVDAKVPAHQRMHVRMGFAGTPITTYMEATRSANRAASGEQVTDAELDADLIPGQRYYFYNHPKYLLKHPGGVWQGENAIYVGKNGAGERMWSGLGANNKTEDAMLDTMVDAYNAERTDYDREVLRKGRLLLDDGTYLDKRYDPAGGEFPDKVTKADILSAPPYTVNGTERKGGFKLTSGLQLDDTKVQRLRDGR